jgi:hypothetical protein
MERLKRMSVFAKVVEQGLFYRCGTTASGAFHRLARPSLNWKMNSVKLLNRSTRSIGLTEAGKIYYQGCRRMLYEVQEVHEQLYAFNNTPIGTLYRLFINYGTKCPRCHDGGDAQRVSGLSVNLVTVSPRRTSLPTVWMLSAWVHCKTPASFPSSRQHADGGLCLENIRHSTAFLRNRLI